MSKAISCTVTVGIGSEKHNHDKDYRDTLEHTKTATTPDAIIELIPYTTPYTEQINSMMRPYIDEYNEHQSERYKAAWERYNNGEIKTKPRRANFKPIGYDYCADHANDVYYNQKTKKNEPLPLWRSLILGLGDKSDRDSNRITKDEAISVIQGVISQWGTLFPDFKLLGATLHLDEQGFYHAHIDYKPIYKMPDVEQGLKVGIGQEGALKRMGFEPEQSIINGRDKAPIRFNAFRNRLYQVVEAELIKHDLRLLYGATKVKEPHKDSSRNQALEVWQATKDQANNLQQMKNTALDLISTPDMLSQDGAKLSEVVSSMEDTITQLEQCSIQKMRKNIVVSFELFAQLKSVLQAFKEFIRNLESIFGDIWKNAAENRVLKAENEQLSAQLSEETADNQTLRTKLGDTDEHLQKIRRENAVLTVRNEELSELLKPCYVKISETALQRLQRSDIPFSLRENEHGIVVKIAKSDLQELQSLIFKSNQTLSL